MSFFMSSMLTPEKRNASFPQLLWIASMFELSLHLKIAIRIGTASNCIKQNQTHCVCKYLDFLTCLKKTI